MFSRCWISFSMPHQSARRLHPCHDTDTLDPASLQLSDWVGICSCWLVMEITSTSMILLPRQEALLSQKNGANADSIHRLMSNAPRNILSLTATLLSMMRRRTQLQQDQTEAPISKRMSYMLSDLAQNAFSTSAGQSILNILNGAFGRGMSSALLAREETPCDPTTTRAVPLEGTQSKGQHPRFVNLVQPACFLMAVLSSLNYWLMCCQ
jgi:hypothetical protein